MNCAKSGPENGRGSGNKAFSAAVSAVVCSHDRYHGSGHDNDGIVWDVWQGAGCEKETGAGNKDELNE